MQRRPTWSVISLVVLLASVRPAFGEGSPESAGAVVLPPPGADVSALAALVDRRLAAGWAEAGVAPAAPAGDAEFLRRVSLDIAGRIPAVAEARAFLDDPASGKRQALVERLLAGPGYVNHFTDVWTKVLLPNLADELEVQVYAPTFNTWLRRQVGDNVAFDVMARRILTEQIGEGRGLSPIPFDGKFRPSPLAFYAANSGKPENLAASTARVFLGIRLECAQCHDHPTAKWKRDQFWSLAAFFSGIEQRRETNCDFPQYREVPGRRELAISGGARMVQARHLDGAAPARTSALGSPRTVLADWVVASDNPFFARAAVNRVWSLFFGTGLVDPVDDMSDENPASHPELLDELAAAFTAHRYDLQFLIRALTATRAYQLTSAGYAPGQDDPRIFARMPVRGMSSRQLYASFVQATGVRREGETLFFFDNSPRKDFLEAFADQDGRPSERRTSTVQALTLMNGRLSVDATDLARSATLPAVADAYFLDTPGKVEVLYLATLSRRPTAEECARSVAYVERGGPTLDPKKALADVLWSLINSAEFVLNH
jgi:hypothetical protein